MKQIGERRAPIFLTSPPAKLIIPTDDATPTSAPTPKPTPGLSPTVFSLLTLSQPGDAAGINYTQTQIALTLLAFKCDYTEIAQVNVNAISIASIERSVQEPGAITNPDVALFYVNLIEAAQYASDCDATCCQNLDALVADLGRTGRRLLHYRAADAGAAAHADSRSLQVVGQLDPLLTVLYQFRITPQAPAVGLAPAGSNVVTYVAALLAKAIESSQFAETTMVWSTVNGVEAWALSFLKINNVYGVSQLAGAGAGAVAAEPLNKLALILSICLGIPGACFIGCCIFFACRHRRRREQERLNALSACGPAVAAGVPPRQTTRELMDYYKPKAGAFV